MNIPDHLRVRKGKETLGKGGEQEWAKLDTRKKNSGKVLYHEIPPKVLYGGFKLEGPEKAPLPTPRAED